jgi:hypothetical protein
MRRILLALPVVLAVLAASAVRAPSAGASCVAVIVWHDVAYLGYSSTSLRPHPVRGRSLDGAVVPACNDTGGGPGSPTSVDAGSIAGVPPRVALLSQGDLYVPFGEFPQTPPFPVGFTQVDDRTRTCHVSSRLTLSGRAEPSIWGSVLVHGKSVFVDVHTRFTGLSRDGVPFVGWHQAVRIDAVRCGHEIVASAIERAGPWPPARPPRRRLGRTGEVVRASWRITRHGQRPRSWPSPRS